MSRVLIHRNNNPLGGAGVYTTEKIDVSAFKILSGFVGTNSSGDLFLEYLAPDSDPETWVIVKNFPVVNTAQFYEFAVGSFMRFRYVNGAVPQTLFSLALYAEYL